MVKVLSLTDADVFAGTERLVLELSAAICNKNAFAMIGCPQPSPLASLAAAESLSVLPVGLPGVPKGLRSDWATRTKIKGLIERREIDLVHAHNGRSALIAAIAGAGRHVPLVMTQHFLSPARTTRRGMIAVISKFVHTWLERRIACHIAISQAVRQASIDSHVAPSTKLSVVLNGIRRPRLDVSRSTWQTEQWAANIKKNPFVFCAARAEPEKDLPTLVQAIEQLEKRHCHIPCIIAGGGRDLDAVRNLVSQKGLSASVKLLGFRQDVAQLIEACSIFVLPARAEPFGLVLLEAMALGKPVIACDAGGPQEIVERGLTGLLVPPGDPNALAQAIEKLRNAPELAHKMGAAGMARYHAYFTADVMAQNMLLVYEKVLDEWNERSSERKIRYAKSA